MHFIMSMLLMVSAAIGGMHAFAFWLSDGLCLPFVATWIPAVAWTIMFFAAVGFGYLIGVEERQYKRNRRHLRVIK